MTDDDRHDSRAAMVRNQIQHRGVKDERVIDAMLSVPRHRFLPPNSAHYAYEDRALPTCCGQTISQPYMVARMTELLEVEPGMDVLEIGTGSGYQTAVLAALGAHVVTVERVRKLSRFAQDNLDSIGYGDNTVCCVGDGSLGWPEHAPYDRILITAAAPHLPTALHEQLAAGGRIVIPEGDRARQTLLVYHETDGRLKCKRKFGCVFVPLRGRDAW